MFRLKENEAEARERHLAFWRGKSIGRPAVIAHVRNRNYAWKTWRKGTSGKERDIDPEWHRMCCWNELFSRKYLGDSLPNFTMTFGRGLVVLAKIAGADYDYDDDNAWIVPRDDALDMAVPKFDPLCDIVKKMEACCDSVIELVGDNAAITPPAMLDAMTTLSMMYNPDSLCLSLIEKPEKVKKVSYDLTTLYMDIYEHFYRYLGSRGYTDTAAWLNIMSEGRMEAVQCDFAVMLSPAMFDDFVKPDLARTTAYMQNSIYHLDGVEQMRFIEKIASCPKLTAIQWNPVETTQICDVHGQLAHLKRIREVGLSLYVAVRSVDDAVFLTKKLGPDGLMITLPIFERESDANAAVSTIGAAV